MRHLPAFFHFLKKLYLKGVRKRRARETANAVEAGIPVISVGNVTAGGTGKTPCILMIAELLLKEGKKPAIISRGYKSGLEKRAASYLTESPFSSARRKQGMSRT